MYRHSAALLSIYTHSAALLRENSGAVLKSRWPSLAPVPNKPTVSVDAKQHSANQPSTDCIGNVLAFCYSTVYRHSPVFCTR